MTDGHSTDSSADPSRGGTAAPDSKCGPEQVTRHRWMLVITSRVIDRLSPRLGVLSLLAFVLVAFAPLASPPEGER
jgi:hypothetical protein